jgi:5'-3' exonuclease
MKIHLLDGTYELFRAYYGAPSSRAANGQEVGATRSLLRSLARLLREPEVTHVAVAFDHVVESFRNELFDGYKTGEGIEAELRSQFALAEEATRALGIICWPMVEFEADDALATAAQRYSQRTDVERVLICTPDKDLAQCVTDKVWQWDRMRERVYDEAGVVEKFGVSPRSIPDYLALVGDAADGIPGIPRWGAKSSSAVLARYGTLDAIPASADQWDIKVRGAATLAQNLETQRQDAELYRRLATLRLDVPLAEDVEALRWSGPERAALDGFCERLGLRTPPL